MLLPILRRAVPILVCAILLATPLSAYADTSANAVASVTVPPNASQFSAILTRDSTGQVGQNATLSYQITYGSTIATGVPVTIQAAWSRGTLDGESTSTVDILDYVTGSGTNAYGGQAPVIDPTNRTITWTIPLLPGHAIDQVVSFKLSTNASYTGAGTVHFSASAHMSGPGFTTDDSTVSNTYKFSQSSTTVPTPTPSPTILKPKPTPPQPVITSVTIPDISPIGSTVRVTTDLPTPVTIRYGTKLTDLTTVLTAPQSTTEHDLVLTGLSPHRTYYFSLSTDSGTSSDVYTFTTSTSPSDIGIDAVHLVAVGEDVIVSTGANQSPDTYIVLPIQTPLTLRLPVMHADHLTRIELILQGARKTRADVRAMMVELTPGIFTGRVLTPITTGLYSLIVTTRDRAGNSQETHIGTVRVSPQLRVIDAASGKSVDHARIQLYLKNELTGNYDLVQNNTIAMPPVLYSDEDGVVPVVLPQGTYKAVASAYGYIRSEKSFALTPASQDVYPTIQLTKAAPGFMTTLRYYKDSAGDFLTACQTFLRQTARIHRFFSVLGILSIVVSLILVFAALSMRMYLPVFALPLYLLHSIREVLTPHERKRLLVCTLTDDQTHLPLPQTHLYAADSITHHVIGRGVTNLSGVARITLPAEPQGIVIHVLRRGYRDYTHTVSFSESHLASVHISLQKDTRELRIIERSIVNLLCEIIGSLFETMLFFSLTLELLYGAAYSLSIVSPFILCTITSLILFIFHRETVRQTGLV